MSDSSLYDLLERLANLLRGELRQAGARFGLQPVHLEVLHYLSCCNRYSDTPAGVAEFLGLTKGTVSQSLLVLENKGFLVRQLDEDDQRKQHLLLTLRGSNLLQGVLPPTHLLDAALKMPADQARALTPALRTLLRGMQHYNERRVFGTCRGCRHLLQTGEGLRCGVTQEALSAGDTTLICREYSSRAAAE